jgi:hypothetical protein
MSSNNPFEGLSPSNAADPDKKSLPQKKAIKDKEDISTQITSRLNSSVEVSEDQKSLLKEYMEKMRWGVTGIAALVCKDEECPYYSRCPLVKAGIPRPVGEECPVENALMDQWLEQFLNTSGVDLESLTTYDLLIIQDIAYQQLLETRAAMELADNPQIQVKTFIGMDPKNGQAMYTYSLNNLVTFREKSHKIKMKLLRELIATAKAKSEEERGLQDRSSIMAEKLRRIEEKLGKDAINPRDIIEAEFNKNDPETS